MVTVGASVSLFEDGQQVPEQDTDDSCTQSTGGPPPPDGPLLSAPGGPPSLTLATPGGADAIGLFCGNTSAPSPVLFKTSPGSHTYDLRYASCGCNAPAPAEFSDRTLIVAPRP